MCSPIRIAYLYAAPLVFRDKQKILHPFDVLDFKTEQDCLSNKLCKAKRQIELYVAVATTDNLREVLTLGYNIIHYSGHGYPDFLAFEDGQGGMYPLTIDKLKQLFEAGGISSVRLVFVSSCYSQKAGNVFSEAGVPHVVAVKLEEPVFDEAAIKFTEQFYFALACGKTVDEAFSIGRASVCVIPDLTAPECERDKFLLLHQYGKHDISIFADAPKGELYNATPVPCPNNLPAIPEPFIGRNIDVYKVLKLLSDNRLVTLLGAPGIGKTALANALAHYFNERCKFSDGVFFINLRDAKSIEVVRSIIAVALNIKHIKAQQENILFDILRMKRGCLLILDNCEDIIHFAQKEFREFLNRLLKEAWRVKILLTSRYSLGGGLQDVVEKTHNLKRLHKLDSALLFFKCTPNQENLVLEMKADNKNKAIDALKDHPVLEQLSGDPLAIKLASYIPFSNLQESIESKSLDEVLQVPGIPNNQLDVSSCYRISINMSVKYLKEKTPEAVRLFALMGLLPGGALNNTLNKIWGNKKWGKLMDILVQSSLVDCEVLPDKTKYFSTLPLITNYAIKLLTPNDNSSFSVIASEYFATMLKDFFKKLRTVKDEVAVMEFAQEEKNIWFLIDTKRCTQSKKNYEEGSTSASIICNLTEILLLAGRISDGRRSAGLGLEICREISDLKGECNCLRMLGVVKARMEDQKGAKKDYDDAISKQKQIKDTIGELKTIKALADLKWRRLKDINGANLDYNQALILSRELSDDFHEACTLKALADLMMCKEDLYDAEDYYKKSIKLNEKIDNPIGKASALKSLADLKMRQEDLNSAQRYYNEAIVIYKNINNPIGEASAIKSLADLKMRLNEIYEAHEDYEKALKLYVKIHFRYGEANTLQSIGDLKMRLNDLRNARDYLESAYFIYNEINEPYGESSTLRSIGKLKICLGEINEAMKDVEKALSIQIDIKNHRDVANTLQSKGYLKILLDDIQGAKQCFDEALSIQTELNDQINIAGTMKLIGDLKMRQKIYDEAEKHYNYAISLQINLRDRLGEAYTLKSLGDLNIQIDKLDEAINNYKKALEIQKEIKDLLGEAGTLKALKEAESVKILKNKEG